MGKLKYKAQWAHNKDTINNQQARNMLTEDPESSGLKPEKRYQSCGHRTRSDRDEEGNLGPGVGVLSKEEAEPSQCQPRVRNLAGQSSSAGQLTEAF